MTLVGLWAALREHLDLSSGVLYWLRRPLLVAVPWGLVLGLVAGVGASERRGTAFGRMVAITVVVVLLPPKLKGAW